MIESLYALPAIVEYWDTQSRLAALQEDRLIAETLALRWWSRAGDIRNEVLASGELTRFGRTFVDSADQVEHAAPASGSSPEVKAIARFNEIDNRICWRLCNLVPEPAVVSMLARSWMAAKPCPADEKFQLHAVSRDFVYGWRARRWLALLKLCDPRLFTELKGDAAYLRALNSDAVPADVQLIDGLNDQAIANYCLGIVEQADDLKSWEGLAVACHNRGDLASLALERFPEVVLALYQAIVNASGDAPDPLDVARWVAPLVLMNDDRAFVPTPIGTAPIGTDK